MLSIRAARRHDEPVPTSRALPHFTAVATSLQPEKRLLLAVLEDAVNTLQHYATVSSGRGRHIFVDAAEWFASTAADRLFDFESICQALGLDPSYIRGGLRRWCNARRASLMTVRRATADG
jgi:hypothetical protein